MQTISQANNFFQISVVSSPIDEVLNLEITAKAIANKVDQMSKEFNKFDERVTLDSDHALFSSELPFLSDFEEM